MTDQHPENNQVLHELLGLKPKRVRGLNMYSRMVTRFEYPDYAADPRLVLEGMREKLGLPNLIDFLFFVADKTQGMRAFGQINVGIVLDRTGQLRELAVDFLGEKTK